MKRRLLIPLITAGAALASGVASANSTYWSDNGLLLEVSADPRDGSDIVQTNPVQAHELELVALNDNVRLRGLTVQFSDGRSFSQRMNTIRPGDHVMVDLPENCGVIQSVKLDYGQQLVDRTPARLQIIPHEESRVATSRPVIRDHRWSSNTPYERFQRVAPAYQSTYSQPTYSQPTYSQPTYSYQQPTPAYVVRPAAQPVTSGWSGYIQGSFRF
jgi:hypothetical protein